jgi:hypothetical protein
LRRLVAGDALLSLSYLLFRQGDYNIKIAAVAN